VSKAPSTEYEFEHHARNDALEALRPEWLDLLTRSGTHNPFVHPAWMTAWLEHLVPNADERLVVAVRRDGELVAVAPFVTRVFGAGPLAARSLQLAGRSGYDKLTEMTEILVAPADRRRVFRALIRHLAVSVGGWDWLGLTLSASQGWFETDWLPEVWQRRGANVVHKAARPFVVLPLPSEWEDLRLKRNQREALRRSRNRLGALPEEVGVSFVQDGDLAGALESLISLHRLRSDVEGHLPHDDYVREQGASALLREGTRRLAADGGACVALLSVAGQPIAGRLLLLANRGVFFSLSGSDPAHWRLCASTALTEASIKRAILEGRNVVNFSSSPDSGKLRWSEQIELQHEFVVVAPSRMSRARFTAWWQVRTARALTRSRRVVLKQAGAAADDE
jgi:CelD/BcsL family acetyltransferase involved in cellulose biosynthesis